MLLDAARECFGEHGYDGTTLDEVARRAGVAKPLLYRHFASKQQLYAQLVLEQSERMQEEVRRALTAAPLEADRASIVLDATFAYIEREPFTWRVLVPERTDDSSGDATALAQRQAMVLRRSLVPEAAAADGLEPASDLDELWATTCTAIQVEVARWWLARADMPRHEVVEHARELLRSVAETLYAGSATRQ